jgi:energy-coupling factor transporter ATP-binding protein EcfA2
MSTKLKSISLKGFRGASAESTVSFAADKKVTMIFGENGTGKSSVVDAFAFVCERGIGSLDDRSGGKINHLVSIVSKPEDLIVTLKNDTGTWIAKLNGASIDIIPATPTPHVRILRRANITRLIEAEPKKRFEELKAFISVPGIESSEETLRKAIKTTEIQLNSCLASLVQATTGLTSYWEKEGKPEKAALDWANKQKAIDVSALAVNVAEIKKHLERLQSLETKHTEHKDKSDRLAKAVELHKAAVDALAKMESELSAESSDLVTLLNDAMAYIEKRKVLSNCPVCENTVEREPLLTSLGKRASQMSGLATAKVAVQQQAKAVDLATDSLGTAKTQFASSVKQALSALLASKLNSLTDSVLDRKKMGPIEGTESEDELIKRGELLASVVAVIRTALENQSKTDGAVEQKRNAIVTYLEQIESAEIAKTEANELLTALRKALEIVEKTRKSYVATVLKEISDEVDRLYAFMHPKESIGGLRLQLKPKVQGSLELQGNFHSENAIAPQAYFSESHLDTLGLCIFLALAKKYRTPDTIVILDDVVTSVDSTHLERFIKLVEAECDHFNHTVITTHYRPWRERYRYHSSANAKMSFVELKGWTLKDGISVHTTRLAADDLGHALEPKNFERQAVASKSGILLEGLFENLGLRYSLRMPLRQPPAYTLGDFMSAFDSKFLQQLKIERMDAGAVKETIEIKPLFEALRELTWIRNQVGAHFNLQGEEISDADVKKFGEATLAFSRALICPVSGEVPNKNRKGTCWESAEGRTCLHPLTVPGARPPGE